MSGTSLGEVVTIIGSVVCNRTTSTTQWHQCCESGTTGQGYMCWNYIRCTTAKHFGIPREQYCNSGDHTPVVYAVEGTPEIENTLKDLVEQYFPEEGMNADQAQLFLDKYTERLKYFISGPYDIVREIHNLTERCSLYLTMKGRPYEKDGVKWFEVIEYTTPSQETDFIPNFPARMLQPDKPIVPNTEEFIYLHIRNDLNLKCVHIRREAFCKALRFMRGVIRMNSRTRLL